MQTTFRHVVILVTPGVEPTRVNEQLIEGFLSLLKNGNLSLRRVWPHPIVKHYQGATPKDALSYFESVFTNSTYGVGLIINPFEPIEIPEHIARRSSHVAVIQQGENAQPPFYPTRHDTPFCFNVVVDTDVEVVAAVILIYLDTYLMHNFQIIHANSTLKEKQSLSINKVQFLKHVRNTIDAYNKMPGPSTPHKVMSSQKLQDFLKNMPDTLPYVSFSSIFLHGYAREYVEDMNVRNFKDFKDDVASLVELTLWFEKWLASQNGRLLQKKHIQNIISKSHESTTAATRLLSKYTLSFLNRRLRGQVSINKLIPKVLNAKSGTYAFILLKKKPRNLTEEKLNALMAIFPGKQIRSKTWTLKSINSINSIPNYLRPYLLIQVLVIVEEV